MVVGNHARKLPETRDRSPGSGLDRIRMQIFNKLPAIGAAALMETTDAERKTICLVGSESPQREMKAEDRERNVGP